MEFMTPLRRGHTLGLFAGSGPVPMDRFQAGCEILEAKGFNLIKAPSLTHRNGFLAGTDDERAAAIEYLLDHAEVDVLMAARGGYGINRILDRLSPDTFRQASKWVIGFSDLTSLHTRLLTAQIECIHGPVVTQLPTLPDKNIDLILDAINNRSPSMALDGPVIVEGCAEGYLWGGNLATFAGLIGTPYLRLPEDQDNLLLLEDVGETTYRVDRLLTQLHLSGILSSVRGVVLGDFANCRPGHDFHPEITDVLKERFSRLKIPVVAGAPIGHGQRNEPLHLGKKYRLDSRTQTLEAQNEPPNKSDRDLS